MCKRGKERPQQGEARVPGDLLEEGQVQEYAVLERTRHQDLDMPSPGRGMWVQVLILLCPRNHTGTKLTRES